MGFREVADRVHVLRHPVLDVNVTLVVGTRTALVVDTLSTPGQAAGLLAAVRALTPLPIAVVNTHHHFDHCFGNAVVAPRDSPAPVYAHETVVELLRDEADRVRRQAYAEALTLDPALAAELLTVDLRAPDHPVHGRTRLDLGDRTVELYHPGRGHTAGDLVVAVPDVNLVIAGDLVEESGPPAFEDSYPLEWPETLAGLLTGMSARTVVVPGHGAVVDTRFVRAQHAELARLAWLIRDGHADRAVPERVAAMAPFGARSALVAIRRGYAELSGDG